MMFEGDSALKKVSVLSGGEKSRVLLGSLLLEPHNLLLLDEPTNHLDMDSCEALLTALEEFDGAVIIVTHNEMFLHSLAERMVVFDRGRGSVFDGSYQNFLDEVGWEGEEQEGAGRRAQGGTAKEKGAGRGAQGADKAENKGSKKKARKEKARLMREKSKELTPLKEKTEELEKKVKELEINIEEVNEKLVTASTSGDGELIGALSKELSDLKGELEQHYEDLFETTEELERLEAKWEEQLEAMN
jgi:ATP-binding cassette subfamily F protein 3